MDVNNILQELLRERREIEVAIACLERLAAYQSGKPRRGRPPKWLAEARALEEVRRKKGGAKKK